MVISRDEYLNQLVQRRHSPYAMIVTDVRRCGKSYLLKNPIFNGSMRFSVGEAYTATDSLPGE